MNTTTSGTFRLQRICFKLLIYKGETEAEHELFHEERDLDMSNVFGWTVAFIWLASTAVSSGVSHWATLSHKLWQRRDEQRPQSYSCSLFLTFCGSLFSSPFPLNHFSLSIPPALTN